MNCEHSWSRSFVASGKDRPINKQYGHPEIKEALGRISYHKCFYSEVKFAELSEAQVDHFIEISEDKNKAFEWENLYLSHKESNMGKPSNRVLPNRTCLDPFIDQDAEIEDNLDFEDEIIKGLTEKGLNTIKNYII